VTLFDSADEIGGQFNLAKRIPGKEEFEETLRYFRSRIEKTGATLKLRQRMRASDLLKAGFDEIVLATGIKPRTPDLPGIDHPKVVGYVDVLAGRVTPGARVAIMGAGGIGFDVAEFLVHDAAHSTSLSPEAFFAYWGVDQTLSVRGGVEGVKRAPSTPRRQVWLLQRKEGKPGASLGKTTGWIHRATLKDHGVQMWGGVTYERVDDQGLHLSVNGKSQCLLVDQVVVCAGQEPLRELEAELLAGGPKVHRIGGADLAQELDAKRAIEQGTRLALQI
jgi:2,4-dienoyl-CoA reductase (NADPH2)